MAYELDFEAIKSATDRYLADVFKRRKSNAKQIGERYQLLWDHIDTVASKGGKRLRPYLTAIGYGKYDEQIAPVAVAQELLHIAMLMHDDVIDQDTMRHNALNINGQYEEIYKPYISPSLASHYANSMAILAGDALLSEAYQCIYVSSFDEGIVARLADQLGKSIFELIGGELLDVEASIINDGVFDPLVVYRYKTAGYSFVGPLIMGATCRNADEPEIEALTQFGINAGIAYQMQDDLLGVYGDEKQTGKSVYSDLREAKQTVLVAEHKTRMNMEQTVRFERVFGSLDATARDLDLLKIDISLSGAEDKVRKMIDEYFERASKELTELGDGVQKHSLLMLLESLRKRRI